MIIKHFRIYCSVIALIVIIPLVCTMIQMSTGKTLIQEQELAGVSTVPEKPSFSLENLFSGQFQSDVEEYFNYHLATRRTLTRVYNQLLYSVFHSTDNASILVGRDDYLYEKQYAVSYLTEIAPESDIAIALQQNVEKLVKLSDLLEARGIPLIVRISPSKVEYYPEYLPSGYHRFVDMKQNGEYGDNWYNLFLRTCRRTDVPVYDAHELLMQMKADGEVVFAKGGTHWTLAPMAQYINGLNSLIEEHLGRDVGRLIEEDKNVLLGQMGLSDDSDIWNICWNTFSMEPNYLSPNISFSTIPPLDGAPIRVFTVGQSFTSMMLSTIYSTPNPVWEETLFSWYNTRVIKYPSDVPWGTQISDQTNDYETYLNMDVLLIDFLESGDGAIQFEFVDNMLEYLGAGEK